MFEFDDGQKRREDFTFEGYPYQAREALEDAAIEYRAASMSGLNMEVGDDGEARFKHDITKVSDTEPVLVGGCVFRRDPAKDEKEWEKVGAEVVKSWPSRVVKPLFNWIKEVSDLHETDDLDALKKQRDKLDRRIAKLEKTGPKG